MSPPGIGETGRIFTYRKNVIYRPRPGGRCKAELEKSVNTRKTVIKCLGECVMTFTCCSEFSFSGNFSASTGIDVDDDDSLKQFTRRFNEDEKSFSRDEFRGGTLIICSIAEEMSGRKTKVSISTFKFIPKTFVFLLFAPSPPRRLPFDSTCEEIKEENFPNQSFV